MRPTDIAITILPTDPLSNRSEYLKGYCKVILDYGFVVRDMRIIVAEGAAYPFVSFPARRAGVRCKDRECMGKRDPGDRFCPVCGLAHPEMTERDILASGHKDCCFPNNGASRQEIQGPILEAYLYALKHPTEDHFVLGEARVIINRPAYDPRNRGGYDVSEDRRPDLRRVGSPLPRRPDQDPQARRPGA